jgi:predicted MFS family arabinose efflux permease
MVLTQVALTRAVPDHLRARATGVVSAGLQTAQGLGVLLAGAMAEILPPSASITICAATGSACAILISLTCRPGTPPADVTASADVSAQASAEHAGTRANGNS